MTGGPGRQLGFSKGVHDYYAHYADNADAKIAALFAVNLAVAGLLLTSNPTEVATKVALAVALALHAAAGLFLGYAIYPRVDGDGPGELFWENVAAHPDARTYAKAALELSPIEIERAYARNNYVVAQILHKKFWAIRIALLITGAALAASAITVALRHDDRPSKADDGSQRSDASQEGHRAGSLAGQPRVSCLSDRHDARCPAQPEALDTGRAGQEGRQSQPGRTSRRSRMGNPRRPTRRIRRSASSFRCSTSRRRARMQASSSGGVTTRRCSTRSTDRWLSSSA